MDIKELALNLCAKNGTPGDENDIAAYCMEIFGKYGNVHRDRLGNILCELGNADSKTHLLLDAHIDRIGLIVTHIDDGFLRVAKCGGMDRRCLPGAVVNIYGKEVITGIVATTPPHLQSNDNSSFPNIPDLVIDPALPKEEVLGLISPGDRILIENTPSPLLGDIITAAGLDDRIGVAAIAHALELIKEENLSIKVTVLLSVQEETGMCGARVGAFSVNPTHAIAVDVGFAIQPGVEESKAGILGEGVMIGFAPSLHRTFTRALSSISKEEGIRWQYDVMGGKSGTNGDAIGIAHEGVQTALLSIPIRSMHTPVETADIRDIEATGQLIAAYLRREAF